MAWNVFSPSETISATKFNENFDHMEGTFLPMNGGANTTAAYDVGSATYQWKYGYFLNCVIGSITVAGFGQGVETNSGQLRVPTASIRSAEIADGTISTPDLRTNALIAATSSSSGSQSTGTTITTVQITTIGGAVLIEAHATIVMQGVANNVNISVDRDGTALSGGFQESIYTAPVAGANDANPFSLNLIDKPAAGTYNYNLRYTVVSGSFGSVSLYGLNAVELRGTD